MKIYTINKLIEGYKVKPEFKGKTLVACKSAKGYTHIQHKDKIMKLPEDPICTLQFQDKFNRGTYFLDYYEWQPAKDLWSIK